METIYLYFIKCFGLIALFFLAYYFLLRKETFFTGNRWFLLAGLFTSVLLPLVFFTKIVWIDPTPNQSFQIPMGTLLEKESFEINWFLIVGIAYAIGLLFFLIKFGIDFFSLTKVLKGKIIQQQADYKFIDVKQNVAPFSYFNYIVYNSDLYSASELENILEHEKIHSAQNHTIDVLIARLFCITFWYNPFIWWYKKAILQNLEFIADSEATKNIADKKAYQITLLKITTHENCVAITNHFYQSLIKKRIVMLNKNQSKKWNSWKYALVIPVLIGFVFLFQIKVIAQEKESHSINQEKNDIVLKIDKNTTDEVLKSESVRLKQDYNIVLKVSNVKRNNNGEIIGIKVAIKDEEGNESDNQVNGNKPIQPMTFVKTINENGTTSIGSYIPNAIDKEITVNIGSPDDVIAIQEIASPSAPEAPEAPLAPLAPPSPPSKIGKQSFISNATYSDQKPLIIIDGVKSETRNEDLSTMDPGKIESITVLKGLEAAAKYGKEGEKGVIVITTKTSTRTNSSDISEDQQVKMDAIQAQQEAEQAKMDASQAKSDAQQAKSDALQAKKDAQQARKDIQQARIDARQVIKDTEQAKKDAVNK